MTKPPEALPIERGENQPAKLTAHTLLTRPIRPCRNWHEWLLRWQAAVTVEDMLGLLHTGMDVGFEQYRDEPRYDNDDRLTFYLGIADGWAGYDLLRLPDDPSGEPFRFGRDKRGNLKHASTRDLRQAVATKAFDMLAGHMFRNNGYDEYDELSRSCRDKEEVQAHYWALEVANEAMFPVILNFFRVDTSRFHPYYDIRNLHYREPESHNERLAIGFLLSLAQFLWEWKEEKIPTYENAQRQGEIEARNVGMRSRLDEAKPWMVEVLNILDRLDILNGRTLDDTCLKKLEEIALRRQFSHHYHPFMADRPVANLDEARYLESEAAWLLARIELRERVGVRLKAIRTAERERDAAAQKLAALTATPAVVTAP